MAEFDPAFIQDIEHRPKPGITVADGIPTIDLSSVGSVDHLQLSDTTDDEKIASLVAEIGDACEKWGFFQVVHHGVPLDKLEKLENAARVFFGLDLDEKRKVRRDEGNRIGYYDTEHTRNVRDWKEVFDFFVNEVSTSDDSAVKRDVNQWPQHPPELREVAQDYARATEKLAIKLVELIALSLGVAPSSLSGYFKDHNSFIRLNHYPPCPYPHLALSVGRHKDGGALTVFHQDEVGGLEVRRKSDGEWIRVKPTPGAFIINVGDIFQVWSNGKYESVEHRVMVNSNTDRLSIPFFYNPSTSVMVRPLEGLISDQNPAKYREYN